MKQALYAAVDPCLVGQSRIVLFIGSQGIPVLEETAGRLEVAGVNHAVSAFQHRFPVVGNQDVSAPSGFFKNL